MAAAATLVAFERHAAALAVSVANAHSGFSIGENCV
jgi:hypothetical protein